MIHISTLDFSEAEAELASLLSNATEPDESVRSACEYLGLILNHVLGSLEKGHPMRRWAIDDLWCEGLDRRGFVVSLRGTPFWLTGGDRCSEFRVDLDLGTQPLLYSYKFRDPKKNEQVLYAAKTPEDWHFNAGL